MKCGGKVKEPGPIIGFFREDQAIRLSSPMDFSRGARNRTNRDLTLLIPVQDEARQFASCPAPSSLRPPRPGQPDFEVKPGTRCRSKTHGPQKEKPKLHAPYYTKTKSERFVLKIPTFLGKLTEFLRT